MNPIQKALVTADAVIAGNREIERISALGQHGVVVTAINAQVVATVSIAESVAQAKREIVLFTDEERDGVAGFGDLHSLCDANTLGFLCDGDDVVFVDAQGPILTNTDPDNDRWMEFGNVVQAEVHAWIVGGHHKGADAARNL